MAEYLDDTEDLLDDTSDAAPALYEHHRIEVEPGQSPLRIDKFLLTRLPNASRTKIQEAADAGNILVNGSPVRSSYKVRPRDLVTLVMAYPRREYRIVPEDIPLDILYEDDSLLVINKPAGMVVHPAFGHWSGTLVHALAWHLRGNPLFDSGDPRPGLVHRIDKDTSGLLVIAKTEQAKARLSAQFFHKTTSRRYIAVCWGNLDADAGTITGHIGRNLRDRKVMACFPDGSHGKPAVTHWRVLERLAYVNVVECILETGRTHQIRAHFQHIRHPLFNDADYGGNQILKGTTFAKYRQFVSNCFAACPRQALHAKTLAFDHPLTGERLSFDSPLPPDMRDLIARWREYTASRLTTNE